MSSAENQRNPDTTCYVGGLDERVDEDLLYELMLQMGPVVSIFLPRDKVTGAHSGYGFVEFRSEVDVEYAMKVMNMVKLFDKAIRVKKSSTDNKEFNIGANIYIGNLAAEVDEKLLFDTFNAFGTLVDTPHVVRDENGETKGYGFCSYDSFEGSDLAIECMNQQYLANQPIHVQYALKKDGHGERHGTEAERLLASRSTARIKPHTLFAGDPASIPPPMFQPHGQPHSVGSMMPGGPLPRLPEGPWAGPAQDQLQHAPPLLPAFESSSGAPPPPPPPPPLPQGQ
eukprot:GSChrysophyteH1.ASY1.ANO1.79.1 assembled CDS